MCVYMYVSAGEVLEHQQLNSMCVYILSKFATIEKGNLKVPFLITATLKYRGGYNSFSWIVTFYL